MVDSGVLCTREKGGGIANPWNGLNCATYSHVVDVYAAIAACLSYTSGFVSRTGEKDNHLASVVLYVVLHDMI